jgi:hypothetical protein
VPAAREPGLVRQSPTGLEVREGDATPSRWQSDLERLDSDLRLRLLTANEPRIDWLAGRYRFGGCRVAGPAITPRHASQHPANGCISRHSALRACSRCDQRLRRAMLSTGSPIGRGAIPTTAFRHCSSPAARGSVDSPMPSRATSSRQRDAPRFDDYWSQHSQRWWDYLRAVDVGIDAAAKAEAAAKYGSMNDLAWAQPLRIVCAEGSARPDRLRDACANLGQALMARGASFALRRAGARIAEINAPDAAARSAAQARGARLLAMTARCTQLQPDFATALESPQPATRARGVEDFTAWANAQAQLGEVASCERVLAAAPR